VHSNIGGGYSKDGLANIPLHWIKGAAQKLGLEFDKTFLGYYRPWYKHELRDSMTLMYRLLIPKWRAIGEGGNTNESVHQTAIDRFQDVPDYKPKISQITWSARARADPLAWSAANVATRPPVGATAAAGRSLSRHHDSPPDRNPEIDSGHGFLVAKD
jgi:hypothetical protein